MHAIIDCLKQRIFGAPTVKEISDDDSAPQKGKWKSVRGWLILAIICLILQSLFIWGNIESFLWWTSDDIISPNLKSIAWASIAHDAVMICYGVVLIVFFFGKRRVVPKLIMLWFGLDVVGKVVIAAINAYALGINKKLDVIAEHYIAPQSPAVSICALQDWASQLNGGIVAALVLAGIMIPYFLMSKQVKATFVR